MNRFLLNSQEGDLIIRDSLLEYPTKEDIKEASNNDSFLCLLTDDEYEYDIGVIVGDWPEGLPKLNYVQQGGHFGVKVSSGNLEICTTKNWENKNTQHQISISPGNYLANVFSDEVDYLEYKDSLVKLLGIKDYEHYTFVEKLGSYAKLPTIFFIGSLFFNFGRSIWFYSILVVLLSWLPYYLIKYTKRYKAILSTIKDHEKTLPSYIVVLNESPSGQLIPGGFANIY